MAVWESWTLALVSRAEMGLAVGDVEVEFVAAPMIVVTPAVSFGADVALGRQVGEHGVEFLAALALDAGAAIGGFGWARGLFAFGFAALLFCRFCSRRASGRVRGLRWRWNRERCVR
ncbi:MAG: hypothetical protein M9913_23355 [Bryobacteraceae bacterium]|nr:hypothetical protein [Bryobacteraceae bacterium]